MKNEIENNIYPIEQLVVLLSNSKYTYAEFTTFHQTVLHILEHSDLTHLNVTQTKNTMFFIKIVVNLLDAPTMEPYHTQNSPVENFKLRFPKSAQPIPAKEDLNKLLNWIDTMAFRNHITIEEMLDQFFLLKLKNLW